MIISLLAVAPRENKDSIILIKINVCKLSFEKSMAKTFKIKFSFVYQVLK